MQISSTLGLSSILDYMDSDNDNSIESVLTANSNYRTAILRQMLMCDKVTHKKLIDSNLLFRKISRNLLSKMIQYNSKKIFF